MLQLITFEEVDSEYGWTTYQAIVENTTGKDFEQFSLAIKLKDSDDVIIETTYSNSINNWKNGEKAKFEFLTESNFAKLEWEASYY